ncbi:MAG: hypothetical protein PHZ07_02635 [Patescibacteria group bacterium]|nr:hypothetical protein [Patescibacteria group bacterium]MDD4304683.1 hypothetical protein [Patescibacteria group bacterium]MDD4695349.1 hypothetical protein [Patescibacteria group bacterium]
MNKNFANYNHDYLIDNFKKESDRASVVLCGSLFDSALKNLLEGFFITHEDNLFTGPLLNFDTKINLAYRLGLISNRFKNDLKIIKSIRNDFSHNVEGCSFENFKIKEKINLLKKIKST